LKELANMVATGWRLEKHCVLFATQSVEVMRVMLHFPSKMSPYSSWWKCTRKFNQTHEAHLNEGIVSTDSDMGYNFIIWRKQGFFVDNANLKGNDTDILRVGFKSFVKLSGTVWAAILLPQCWWRVSQRNLFSVSSNNN
jgi:hypothetical protein